MSTNMIIGFDIGSTIISNNQILPHNFNFHKFKIMNYEQIYSWKIQGPPSKWQEDCLWYSCETTRYQLQNHYRCRMQRAGNKSAADTVITAIINNSGVTITQNPQLNARRQLFLKWQQSRPISNQFLPTAKNPPKHWSSLTKPLPKSMSFPTNRSTPKATTRT